MTRRHSEYITEPEDNWVSVASIIADTSIIVWMVYECGTRSAVRRTFRSYYARGALLFNEGNLTIYVRISH